MAEKGEYVGSGSFRVDQRKAVEVLSRYQLPDPGMFILPLVRCAVVRGAADISIELKNWSSLELAWQLQLAFDGISFSEETLRSPYDCLFAERAERDQSAWHLAIGLLSALRAAPESVTVSSGQGEKRLRLRITSLEDSQIDRPREPEERTVIEMSWGRTPPTQTSLAACEDLLRRKELFGMSPVPIHLAISDEFSPHKDLDEDAQRLDPVQAATTFGRAGVRGWLHPVLRRGERLSMVSFFHYGVFLSEEACDLPAQVAGCVNAGRITLNASHTGAVRDGLFEDAMKTVSGRVRDMLRDNIQEQVRLFPAAVKLLLEPDMLRRWQGRDSWWSFAHDLWAPRRESSELARHASRADWLHDAAGRLSKDPANDRADPVRRALWNAPMFPTVTGGTLSLLQAEQQRRRLGAVPYARACSPAGDPERVWCPSSHELAWLKARFGANIREEG